MIRILTFTNLYPNSAQPRLGIFVEQRLRHLIAGNRVQAQVVAPVPWFPSQHPRFGRYAVFAKVPFREQRHGIDILHPRYPVLPKVGASLAPLLMTAFVQHLVRKVAAAGAFDLVDAHYFYPDGVAAVMLGRLVGLPVVITARGSDLNVCGDERLPGRWIRWAQSRAAACVSVSAALKRRLVKLGADEDHVTVLRNGVDLELFRPVEQSAARRHIGIGGPMLLAVGNLVACKRQHIAIRALAELANVKLILAGDGELHDDLRALARQLGVTERVHFVGEVPQEELRYYYSAADGSVLLSEHEGMPNVVLESMACGTPVIATPVGGVPEVISSAQAGILLDPPTPEALADAFRELRAGGYRRENVRRHAERLGWDETTRGLETLFEKVLSRRQARAEPSE